MPVDFSKLGSLLRYRRARVSLPLKFRDGAGAAGAVFPESFPFCRLEQEPAMTAGCVRMARTFFIRR
jgi:hypothetical protein